MLKALSYTSIHLYLLKSFFSKNLEIDIDELGHKGMTTQGRYCQNQELK